MIKSCHIDTVRIENADKATEHSGLLPADHADAIEMPLTDTNLFCYTYMLHFLHYATFL